MGAINEHSRKGATRRMEGQWGGREQRGGATNGSVQPGKGKKEGGGAVKWTADG